MPKFIILDTGAILRVGAGNFGEAKLLTTPSVLAEIHDKSFFDVGKTSFLEALEVVNPSEDCCKFVDEFSKKTGDSGFLSITDIHVIALTLMFHRIYDDKLCIRSSPAETSFTRMCIDKGKKTSRDGENEFMNKSLESGGDLLSPFSMESHTILEQGILGNSGSESEGEWVTKSNIDSIHGGLSLSTKSNAIVACMTLDYSMQNVIVQMGLNVLSICGYLIKSIKRWELICRGCYNFEKLTDKYFCSKCGNATLDRVPIEISSGGLIYIKDNRRKINLRGTIYSIPKPKTGRKSKSLIFAEDQLLMGGIQKQIIHKKKQWEKIYNERIQFNNGVNFQEVWNNYKYNTKTCPEVVIGMGKGNPNSNRWQKKNKSRF
ncbi:uncharacterized protein CMU_033530 [Cryptosporidium muris RN66]|uniref:Uncharacterized protein n=1 Tax=Cryptosporidium muris (strain RN66) TaxID=441375 RepID=B6AFH7_CRYMR|nr:uncharacterized protein CMU_033530 [Cryptosporidium muris RN66]EEA06968.1 hypothetical protein, conserved [Cryptosporidium muris RN66]|eukprot:XP_002141317.1 hypothetical protein [Cryptosporidium muris RN66]